MSLKKTNKKIKALAKEFGNLLKVKNALKEEFNHEYHSIIDVKKVDEWKESEYIINLQQKMTNIKQKLKINQRKAKYYKVMFKKQMKAINA